MARAAFESLDVYKLSERLADAVWKVVRNWDSLSRDTVGKQLVRAADSIGANIAEGVGAGPFRTTADSSRLAEDRFTKSFIGCAAPMSED